MDGQVEVFVVGGGLGVLDTVDGALDGYIRAGHNAVLGPDGDAVLAQRGDRALHQLRRPGHLEQHQPDALGQVDDQLGFPAQQLAVEVQLVAVLGDMA